MYSLPLAQLHPVVFVLVPPLEQLETLPINASEFITPSAVPAKPTMS
jgi:hypothetical protein